MRLPITRSTFFASLLGSATLASFASAGVVDTLGTPTSSTSTIGNLPTWNGNGDQQDATFAAYIDFSPNLNPASRQLIWETGGRNNGASLVYGANNTLYLRVRQGGNIADLSWELAYNQLNAGEILVSWVFDLGNNQVRLIMDGINANNNPITVASTAFNGSDWSGSGAAAFGAGTQFVGGYSGLSAFVADPFTSGSINTVDGLEFYQNQAFLPSPVPEPLGVLAGVAAIGFSCFRRRRQLA